MISLVAALLIVSLSAVIVRRARLRRVLELFERYPPHAPMAEWSAPFG